MTRLPPDLYDRDGYVIWSGGYSDFDREQGAEDLRRWRETTTSFPWLDVVYAHSHGGNVALDALARGQQVKLLVLLDTPANRRTDDEWVAIRSNVGGVIAMRTRLDLVVTADSLRNFEGPDQVRWTEASPFPGDWPLGHERGMVLALLLRDARKLGTIRPR